MKTKGMQFVEQKVCLTHMHDDAMTHAKCDAGLCMLNLFFLLLVILCLRKLDGLLNLLY